MSSAPIPHQEDCFHCGLPVPAGAAWSVEIQGLPRAMCCPGCEAVAKTIVESGLSDYYASRTAFSPRTGDDLVPEALRLYDTPEAMQGFARAAGNEQPDGSESQSQETVSATFSIEGIRSAACIWLIERRLSMVPGVLAANLNVATEQLHVRWKPAACKPSDILSALRSLGYTAYPYDPVKHEELVRRQAKRLFRQVFIAGLSMMQVMMYAVPAYLATDGTMDADMAALMRWASLWLTVPAVFYSALPFFRGAWANLKTRALGMDVPVAIGIAAAFGGSVVNTVQGSGEVYFDSVTMFIFLLLCSRYLETAARRKAASALERLQRGLPPSASRLLDYPASRDTETVPAARLVQGDLLQIRPGESVAADCVIVEGASAIDLSLLTGESVPVRKGCGDALPGGAVNASQPLIARVLRPTTESTLSSLVKLIERAGQEKPRLAQWADRVAAWFVGALLLFAAVVFAAWQWLDPARSWAIAIAVLVVSCPCALSLATPTALAAAIDRLVRQGVLVIQPHVLETLHRCTHIVFDKTGTLTNGKPTLRRIEVADTKAPDTALADRCLQIAAAMEQASSHPLAAAIVDAARARSLAGMQAEEIVHTAGEGLQARIEGTLYRLGRVGFVAALGGPPVAAQADASVTAIYLGTAAGPVARFELEDSLRDDARETVRLFQHAGKEVILLSGDRQEVCAHVAAQLGIREVRGDCLPERKLAFVQELQARGGVVAMVGDGINDAAVLRAADVSFAMGGGAALAQTHADAVLLSGRIASVAAVSIAAKQTMTVIRQNLGWATLYNAIAIPAAAFGLLNPWLSGVGMSLSSAFVILNALRLRRVPRQASPQAPAHAGMLREQAA
ncbi:heavy metal translocating P-type ATPase [Noviherbaspirillum galbum]|uniref:Cadmium-translocating P-type ATPase n=1 Tax=Noviherbaspirillum galbum TaxID=2709383 RepID=A0A6B3SN18_9BURK|nr:heavy metal translocating P-type ATPase [Noviherbaspirillum galbum]NEX62280.1 cadmium-translocating P-type ATPase [Noviherbaspirillum galbum]